MRWPTFTPKERTMPDTPEPGLVDLDLLDPETTADLGHAAERPDPSYLAEFADVPLPEEDVPAEPDPPAAHAEHCPTCGQDVPPMRALIADTMKRVDSQVGPVLDEYRHKAVSDRPHLARLVRIDTADVVADFLNLASLLAERFDPADAESMGMVDAEVAERATQDGPVSLPDPSWPGGQRPPSLLDHAVLIHHLVAALRTFQGDSWTPLHTRAWHTALTYAAARMCAAQILGGAR